MKLRTFPFIFLVIVFLLQPMNYAFPLKKSSEISKKEIAMSVAKIAGYSAEMTISVWCYYYLNTNHGTYPSLKMLYEYCSDIEIRPTILSLLLQTPFLASIAQGAYGVVTEGNSLAQNIMNIGIAN